MSVHHAHAAYARWGGQQAYGWVADHPGTSASRRWWLASYWWHKAIVQHAAYAVDASATTTPVQSPPGWFISDLACIGLHEEGGHNSVAGYYGFIYPPASYPGGSGYASWLDVPLAQQQLIAWLLYGEYGWSPWSTAPGCGL